MDGLKPFTIICGERRKLDCYLGDLSLPLYWAKTKEDVFAHLIRSCSHYLTDIPLSTDSDYYNTPSDFHLFHCKKASCPCSKYAMCSKCQLTREALPKEGVEIECNGYTESLRNGEEEPDYCRCENPDFRGDDKVRLCEEAIDDVGDHCFKLIELAVEDPVESVSDDGTERKAKVAKTSAWLTSFLVSLRWWLLVDTLRVLLERRRLLN